MLVVVGLVIAFVIVAIFAIRNRDTRLCRWRLDRSHDPDKPYLYRCMYCGAEAHGNADEPPAECFRDRGSAR